MNKQTIITALFALVAMAGQAQSTFDTGDGCLNVIDVSYAQGIGEYGDGGQYTLLLLRPQVFSVC